MRLVFFLIVLGVTACHSPAKESEVETMDANDISIGPVVHDTLSPEQLANIQKIHATFGDSYHTSLEETITNFKRDQNPDNEIKIWLNMAAAYQKFITAHHPVDSMKKEEAFKLLLLRSMMADEKAIKEAQLSHLSPQEAADLLGYYTTASSPLKIKRNRTP